ncbi:MAG: tautomerase family protein [Thermomicrobiales bacterium]|nr:tautomerase family protein [Thermomicrobiales bacterium]
MAQFKIYGRDGFLRAHSVAISNAIHAASVAGLGLPEEKRFHRFIPLADWQFIAPPDRSERYLIIEVMMFTGRSVETKKAFYRLLLQNLDDYCGIGAQDVELTITESPRHDWLIRGLPGDELPLNYRIDHNEDRNE